MAHPDAFFDDTTGRQYMKHPVPRQYPLLVAEGKNSRVRRQNIRVPAKLFSNELHAFLDLVLGHRHEVGVPDKCPPDLLLGPPQTDIILHPAIPFGLVHSGEHPKGVGEGARLWTHPEVLHGGQALIKAGRPVHKSPGVGGEELDENLLSDAVFAEHLELGKQDDLEVVVDELHGLLDGGEHVLFGAEKVLEEAEVGAQASLDPREEEAVGAREEEAAQLGGGEAELAEVEVQLSAECDRGKDRGVRGDETRDGGGGHAERVAEERDHGVRVLGGAEVHALGRLRGVGFFEAAGVAKEVDRQGSAVASSGPTLRGGDGEGGGDAGDRGRAAYKLFDEMSDRRGGAGSKPALVRDAAKEPAEEGPGLGEAAAEHLAAARKSGGGGDCPVLCSAPHSGGESGSRGWVRVFLDGAVQSQGRGERCKSFENTGPWRA